MKYNFLKSVILMAVVSVSVTSCIKDDITEAGDVDAGKTFIKIPEAREHPLFFSVFSDVKTVDLFSVRKDANSKEELNTATTVKVTRVDALIDEYNDANGETFEPLPDSIYTANIPLSGGIYDMSLGAGEFAKEFTIKLNGAKWDISHKYALAVVLSDIGGKTVTSGLDTVISFISVKNDWDGVYEVTGTVVDVVNPALLDVNLFISSPQNTFGITAPMEYELRTLSPTKCASYDNHFYGGFYVPLTVDNLDGTYNYSSYGSFSPIFEFDPSTNAVVAVTNYYGQPAGNTRSGVIAADGINTYDPDTKTMEVKYYMLQPSTVPAAPHIRTTYTQTWKYIGSR